MNAILKSELTRLAPDVLQNPKVAAAVALTTTATGTSTAFEWIPKDIGLIAAFLGAVLTLILIIGNILRIAREGKSHELKIKKLELEILQASQSMTEQETKRPNK